MNARRLRKYMCFFSVTALTTLNKYNNTSQTMAELVVPVKKNTPHNNIKSQNSLFAEFNYFSI